jgi:dienelactone hydrolase
MKTKLFILFFFLLGPSKLWAQHEDADKAHEIISDIRIENYDAIQDFIAPGAAQHLTPAVFKQIRQTMTFKNGEAGTGEFTSVKSKNGLVLTAKVSNGALGLNINLTFNSTHQLVQVFLEPNSQGGMGKYKNPVYTDSTSYEEQPVLVQTGQFILPGTLTLPKGKKNFPVLVFVHGSGISNRDEALFVLKPFRDIAIGLAAKGIATLRYDKRNKVYGEAASVPEGKLLTISEETTDDARSAINLALTVPGADPKQVYLIGHSLGGMMTPKITAENPRLAGAIFLSGPARSFLQSIEDQYHHVQMNQTTLDGILKDIEIIKHLDTLQDKSRMLLQKPAAYWADLDTYKQLEVVKTLKQPLFFLQGERDYQVPPSDLELWRAAVKNKKNVTMKTYPKLNHFYTEGTGISSTQEYFNPANVPVYIIDDIAAWVLNRNK